MENLELSPAELMKTLNWKKSKVYYWISQGKFETVERLDGQKVVISQEDIQRLQKSGNSEIPENFENVSESFVNSENIPTNSEKIVQNFGQNVTKNYKTVSNFTNSEAYELFSKSLETIERIHQTALSNFGYTTKLLTDGKSEVQEENLELRAEVKTIQARLEKSQKVHVWKNIIILILLLVLICLTGYIVFSSTFSKMENIDTKNEQVQNPAPAHNIKK